MLGCGGTTVESSDGTDSGAGGNTGGAAGSGGSGIGGVAGGTGGSSASGGSGGTSVGGSGGTSGAAGASWDACDLTSECVIRSQSCCGTCGAATRDDVTALNQDFVSTYASNECLGQGCPACYKATDPTLFAQCMQGLCTVVDLLQHPVTQCSSASDCRIRTKDCCECGGGMNEESLLAINVGQEAAFSALVCDPNTACPECMPDYPDVVADCQNGRCIAVW